jgi:predicted ArsR family transcriptional regulator
VSQYIALNFINDMSSPSYFWRRVMATRKEILLKAENNRQAIFDAIGNEVLDVWAIDNKIGIGDKIIKNHLNTLTIRGHIITAKMQRLGDGKWIAVYRQTDKPYIAKTEDELNISKEEKMEYTKRYADDLAAMKANPNLRIIRRLNTRVEMPKRSNASQYKGIGSSFAMWESA